MRQGILLVLLLLVVITLCGIILNTTRDREEFSLLEKKTPFINFKPIMNLTNNRIKKYRRKVKTILHSIANKI